MKPCAPWATAISRRAARCPGRWRMTSIIPGLISPAATTACARTLPAASSRTRTWSIFPTGSRSSFASAMGSGSTARTVKILSYRQELDLRRGMLLRTISFEDRQGRRATIRKSAAWCRWPTCTWRAWSWHSLPRIGPASVTVRSGIDGRVVNAGAKLYRKFNNKHLEYLGGGLIGEDSVYLLVRTSQSNLRVARRRARDAFLDGESS